VQVHMSRLRKALGDGELVETTPAGYRLRVLPGELDAERFDELVDAGRRALADGDPELASSLLREALGLWRGPPLSDLAHEPFAAAEIRRLEERRLAAIELAIDGDRRVLICRRRADGRASGVYGCAMETEVGPAGRALARARMREHVLRGLLSWTTTAPIPPTLRGLCGWRPHRW
jgi:hypothetical protein